MFGQHRKNGDNEGDENRRSRYPGEIWTTSLATNVEKEVIMIGTMTDQLKPGSKKM